jgi:hypothetical protein
MKNTTKMNPRYEAPKPDLLTRKVMHVERHPAVPHSKQTLTQVVNRLSRTNTPTGTKETVNYDGRTVTVKRVTGAVLVTGFATSGTVRYRLDKELQQHANYLAAFNGQGEEE